MKIKYLLFLFFTFYASKFYAQKFIIQSIEENHQITAASSAVFMPDDSGIIFSSVNKKGLFIYDFFTSKVTQLNDDEGAGYNFCVSPNTDYVFYKTYTINSMGKRYNSICKQSLFTFEKTPIVENIRNMGTFFYRNGDLVFTDNAAVKIRKVQMLKRLGTAPYVLTDDQLNLIIVQNNVQKILNPLSDGNYIWVSLSPDAKSILFNKTGAGTYVCNLEGTITAHLGRLHAAKWSADGKWIIGMNDFDDGYAYTQSKIVLVSVDGKNRQELDLKDIPIALYPDWSKDMKKIVFNNDKGNLYILTIKELVD